MNHSWQIVSDIVMLYCTSVILITCTVQLVLSKMPIRFISYANDDGIVFCTKSDSIMICNNMIYIDTNFDYALQPAVVILYSMFSQRNGLIIKVDVIQYSMNGLYTSLLARSSSRKCLDPLLIIKWSDHLWKTNWTVLPRRTVYISSSPTFFGEKSCDRDACPVFFECILLISVFHIVFPSSQKEFPYYLFSSTILFPTNPGLFLLQPSFSSHLCSLRIRKLFWKVCNTLYRC